MSEETVDDRDRRIEELATGFALGELQEDELKELYDYLRDEHADDVAAITWKTLAGTLDMKMKLSPHFADTVRHRIEKGDEDSDDAFSGGILARLGKRRKQLDPVAVAEQRKKAFSLMLIIIPLLIIVTIVWLLMPSNTNFPTVRHVTSGGKVFQQGDVLEVNTRVDQRQIAVAKNALLTLEWPSGNQVSVQGPATILVQDHGMSIVNGIAWLRVDAGFTIGLPDQFLRSKEQSEIAIEVEDSASVVGLASGLLTYGKTDSQQEQELTAQQALWNGKRLFRWQYSDGDGIKTTPVQLNLDPIAAHWQCGFKVSFNQDDAMLIARGLDKKAEEMELRIQPLSISAHKNNVELWRYALSGAPRSPRRVFIQGRLGAATMLSINGLEKKIQWHLHAPLNSIEMQGAVALTSVHYRTGPPPIPDFAFVDKE